MNHRALLLLAGILLSQVPANSQVPDSVLRRIMLVEKGLKYDGKTYLDIPTYTLETYMKNSKVPGLSIAVINNFQIEWTKGYGWADLKEEKPVTTEVAFGAASVSKAINGFAFLKLAQDGKIDLHEDINNILTSWKFPYAGDIPITSYQLLTHTSGLWYHTTSTFNHDPIKPTLIKMLDRKRSPQDKSKPYLHSSNGPGMKREYTNVGISVSQQVLIDATGMEYEDYVRQEVFDPLGMENSFYLLNKKRHNFASGYRESGKRLAGKYRPVVEYAPGGLWTTPTDLAKFVIDIQRSHLDLSNKVLTSESLKLMLTPSSQILAHNNVVTTGVGSFLINKNGYRYFLHEGHGSGFTALIIGSYEGGKGVVILTNGTDPSLTQAAAGRVAEVYGWEGFLFNNGKVVQKAQIDSIDLNEYTGKFSCVEEPTNQVELYIQDEMLWSQFSGGADTHPVFMALSDTEFFAESFSFYSHTMMEFQKSKGGEFDNFILSNSDKSTTWIRLEGETSK